MSKTKSRRTNKLLSSVQPPSQPSGPLQIACRKDFIHWRKPPVLVPSTSAAADDDLSARLFLLSIETSGDERTSSNPDEWTFLVDDDEGAADIEASADGTRRRYPLPPSVRVEGCRFRVNLKVLAAVRHRSSTSGQLGVIGYETLVKDSVPFKSGRSEC